MRRSRVLTGALAIAALGVSCTSSSKPETPRRSTPSAPATGTEPTAGSSAGGLNDAAANACPATTAGRTVVLTGRKRQAVRFGTPEPGTIFDARRATFEAYPEASMHPFAVGSDAPAARVCVVGGIVVGSQRRDLTWDEVKDRYDGDGLRIAGHRPYGVDGLRVDNVEDGIAPRGTKDRYPADGDGFVFRNLYFTYIRDDCVENDEIAGGAVYDSLFDGCYTGISERPSDGDRQWSHPAPSNEMLLLDGVLLRLQPMPGPRGTHDKTVLGHGQLFKWSTVAHRLVIRRSIFLVEQMPSSTSAFPFPAGTRTDDVTIVWLGPGPFQWDVPEGTTVTTDRVVWDEARSDWLERHGCASFRSCTRLHDPAPAN